MRRITLLHGIVGVHGLDHPPVARGAGRSTARAECSKESRRRGTRRRPSRRSLCGPMVIADTATGTIATSQPAPGGDRPRVIGFVNTPVQWVEPHGPRTTRQMICQVRQAARRRLFMPAAHRVQPGLGLMAPSAGGTAASIRWKAATGCGSSGGPGAGAGASARGATSAVGDALGVSRGAPPPLSRRRGGRTHVDIDEGIATYTQYVAGSDSVQDAIRRAVAALATAEIGTSFVRTFAYASGAGYGCCSTRCLQAGIAGSLRRAMSASCSQPRRA